MSVARITRGCSASTALAAGLAIGIAANAAAQPTQPDKDADFLQCLVDHQDTDGIAVCCVFYGGDYDERQRSLLLRLGRGEGARKPSDEARQAGADGAPRAHHRRRERVTHRATACS